MGPHALIVGAGAIGEAIHSGLAELGELWDRKPERVPGRRALKEAVADADAVLLCVPASAIKEVLPAITSGLTEKSFVVSLSKGLDEDSGKFVPDIIEQFLSQKQFGLLAGPMLAEELVAGKGGVGVVASENAVIRKTVPKLFRSSFLRFEESNDMASVALVGVLKNVYAIAAGMADALGYGQNIAGWLVTQAIGEMQTIARAVGSDETVAVGTAGIGDFVATATSPYSLNREAGQKIVRGTLLPKSEGIGALPIITTLCRAKNIPVPLLYGIADVALAQQPARTVFEALLVK